MPRHADRRPRATARARRGTAVAVVLAATLSAAGVGAASGATPTAGTPTAATPRVVAVAAPRPGPTSTAGAQRARQQRAAAALAAAVASARSRWWRAALRFNPGPFGSGVLGDYSGNAVIRRTGCLTADPGRRVAVVGDSLTTRSRSALDVRMAEAGIPFCLNAQGGRPTRATVNALLEIPRDKVDAVVVASGSNDVFDPLVLTREIDRVMAYAGGAPVYWVTVYVDRWYMPTEVRRADQRNTALVNSLLARATARHRNLVLIDWYSFLTRVYGRAATYLVDGVHTNLPGTDARALIVTRTLLALFGPPPAPPAPPAPTTTEPTTGPTTTGPTTSVTCGTPPTCSTSPTTSTTTGTTSTGPTTTRAVAGATAGADPAVGDVRAPSAVTTTAPPVAPAG